ncbi:MAG TPA: peptide chain release factor N(5)-glutamine methyltransferase [bacterium]|jgi:release factor glutamine methyltransferase|nr:peptide chain release factor N(5)-glutamine methyltransferase [Myxococcales bacterium]OQA61475.1 MAG: Release factor glutamine methyltransferase [bacterium ADurb.Bin270]HPW45520.1 peptide chain release factor N(5)-glutamine methyltransferase [bacterium]HQC50778.1 peptide chain release factor N(5)-glutamine methyltransferase [bacterium]HQG13956.1 peptide chain release factor N(5)-glutamine methyltransferase [bacterium]
MKIAEAISVANDELVKSGSPSARLDAEVLLSHALKKSRPFLYLDRNQEIENAQYESFISYISRRSKGEPIAYITGEKEFWSLPVKVTRDVLIPRPETELVVEMALSMLPDRNGRFHMCDICTGSGNIPMAILHERPQSTAVVSDISSKAIMVAKENLARAQGRVTFLEGDLLGPAKEFAPFDLITANPPYISTRDAALISKEVAKFEPHEALFAGELGLDFIKRIVEDAPDLMNEGGALIIEIGFGQGEVVRSMLTRSRHLHEIEMVKDLAGIERVAKAVKCKN